MTNDKKLTLRFSKYILNFKKPSGTSRGVMTEKETYFLVLTDEKTNVQGWGECGLLRGLSFDDRPGYEEKLQWLVEHINDDRDKLMSQLAEWPSIKMGLEMAFLDFDNGGKHIYFDSHFTKGKKPISINGLIWMGSKDDMLSQIEQKINDGFSCIKMKIGAINFKEELECLKFIRDHYDSNKIELRVDANGAFDPDDADYKLEDLAQYDIHSIEQPIRPQQWDEMAELCRYSPIPIALDEELIGIFESDLKKSLLDIIQPHYIILKPSLIGGFESASEYVKLAEKRNIGWWATSALESNIGLNAIAQWTATTRNKMPQGLGTGSLYTNNLDGPTYVENGSLHYDTNFEFQTFLP
jgi:o-succinylbenzoate synthase